MYLPTNIFLSPDVKMSDVVLSNPYLLLMLEHFGINAPLQDKTIQTICIENEINTELFLTFANLYFGVHYTPKTPLRYEDTYSIITFLKNSHKFYSEDIYPNILDTISQMTSLNRHKEMSLVSKFFVDYFNEVTQHLDYENTIVFPYVLGMLDRMKGNKNTTVHAHYSVKEYKEHHDDIEEKLNDLKSLLIKYLPLENDLIVRRKLLFLLSELDHDLNIHSKIEEFILVPLVAEMETINNLK